MSALEKLLSEVREAPLPVDKERLVRQRNRLVSAAGRERSSALQKLPWLWGIAGATLATVLGLVWVWQRGGDASEKVEAQNHVEAREVWWNAIDVPTQHVIDGRGELSLVTGASAHLRQQGPHVDVSLERGEVASRVVPHRGTAWSVQAGAYSVQAVGTEFRVRHEPAQARLDVTVEEGTVRVAGGALGGSDVLLHAGQALHVDGARVSIDRRASTKAEEPTSALDRTDISAIANPANPGRNIPTQKAPEAENRNAVDARPPGAADGGSSDLVPAAAPADWKTHHLHGNHKAALEAAVRRGFEDVLRQSSCSDLSKLADTARLAGDPARSTAALSGSRARCAGTADGARSAFLLGRQLDSSKPSEAAAWYQTYLSESPGGAFAEQALGRLLAVQERSGQRTKAQANARLYLQKYPKGLYAELAQTLLEP